MVEGSYEEKWCSLSVIWSCGKNRVQCVSVPNERLRTGVVAYLGWQRISFWNLDQDIPMELPYTSMHMFDDPTW